MPNRRLRRAAATATIVALSLSACDAGIDPAELIQEVGELAASELANQFEANLPTDPADASDGATTSTDATSPIDEPQGGINGVVIDHVDGDTLYVDSLETRIRLIGIDTPEVYGGVECFGREASQHIKDLLPLGTAVRVIWDVDDEDQYGRPLAYLVRASDGLFINLAMVLDGYAHAATYPPNVAHAETFAAAQAEAREAERGLWAEGACPDA